MAHRVLDRALPRYGQLLTPKEVAALRNFTRLSLPARQLLARLLTRKWPQWVPMDNLGARYRELGVAEAQAAAAELAGTSVRSEVPGEGSDWSRYLAELPADQEDPSPWLLDTASETAASLLQTPLPTKEENLGRLLLQALPAAELRRMGRGLGMGNSKGGGQRGAKGKLLAQVCEAARQQRPLIAESTENSEAHLVSEALTLGRRLCLAPCPGRAALGVLSELFRLESCGAPEVSYVLFTTRWPDFPFKEPAPPLFQDRSSLDAFLDARALVAGLQDFQRPTLASAEEDAQRAEERLQKALALEGNAFEAAKFQDPFRRRFTAAWCYAEALHHAVLGSPAVGAHQALQLAKIRRLRLLLSCRLSPSKRGRWYAELAKELSRREGPRAALALSAAGLLEGAPQAPAPVDLTSDGASQEDCRLEALPRDARWDLARRCRALAKKCDGLGPRWRRALDQVADGGWLPELVVRLIEEEESAAGPIRNLSAGKLALPQVGAGHRRMFDGFLLEELTVEELAMQHYFSQEGGGFQCGVHCEGAILRDLFAILLFDQMFDCSVEGAFVSAFQDPMGPDVAAWCAAASLVRPRAMASVTGMPPGPFAVGVTTLRQFDDHSRQEEGGPRSLQTEIWYPAEGGSGPSNRFSDFLGRGAIPGSLEAADAADAIGGYREGLSVRELDETWPNTAQRDARLLEPKEPWPLVIFSHGSGAFRASYIFWTEFLASQGFVVVACDHPGSARYTQVNGKVVKPGGARSERAQMEADRPKDVLFLLDSMSKLAMGQDSRFAGRLDTSRAALTGMSFGGWTTAAALEELDDRVKAAVMMCPSMMSAGGRLMKERKNRHTPVMVMVGSEDTVIGAEGVEACRQYAKTPEGSSCLVEIREGGHCSFTSCELYNPSYGNGIGRSKSLTQPGEMYDALPIARQHEIINTYGLAFLDKYLRGGTGIEENRFENEMIFQK
ncbi:unnamed protein product [Effrenium voratum]|nr:unnamed protein product [Effrenium voratum]